MMKTKLVIATVFCGGVLACFGQGQPVTVNYSAAPGQKDVWTFTSPAAVPIGNSVMVGCFDPGFNVSGNGNDLSLLWGAWHVFGSTSMGLLGNAGRFSGSTAKNDSTFNGQQIWMWIFKTTGNNAPNTVDFSNVTEYGLFSGTAGNWIFPSTTGTPPLTTDVTSSQVNVTAHGSFTDPSHLFLNAVSPVPEPTTGALIALGLGWFGWMARQRNRPKS